MSAYAVWRRALRRVERRARTYLEARDRGSDLATESRLLGEAARLANRLAPGPRHGR